MARRTTSTAISSGLVLRALGQRRGPYALVVAAGLTLIASALIWGGPRTGYIEGALLAPAAFLILDSRLRPSQAHLWAAATVVLFYLAGGCITIGDNVLAHWSLGPEVLRYDHMLHAGAGAVMVLVLAAVPTIGSRPPWGSAVTVMALAVGAGLFVEGVEWLNSVVLPSVFTFQPTDSRLDTAANLAGISAAIAILTVYRRSWLRGA